MGRWTSSCVGSGGGEASQVPALDPLEGGWQGLLTEWEWWGQGTQILV